MVSIAVFTKAGQSGRPIRAQLQRSARKARTEAWGQGDTRLGEGVLGTFQARPKLSLEGWAKVSCDGGSKWTEWKKGAPGRVNSTCKNPGMGESIQGAVSSSLQLYVAWSMRVKERRRNVAQEESKG